MISLAEAIFVFTDELATDVVEGYLRMQSDEAGERERRRRRLASLLLDPDGADPEAIEHAAELARWPLPRRVAVLALDADEPGAVARGLDVDALVGSDAGGAWLVLPDPDGPGRGSALRARVGDDAACASGPTVAPRDASRSLRWARMTLELVRAGRFPRGADEGRGPPGERDPRSRTGRLASSCVGSDSRRSNGCRAAERERLLETLESWLAHQRHTPRIAAELHVHPQTVRYRIGKLRELLGDALETADGRFQLDIALRARRGLAGKAES